MGQLPSLLLGTTMNTGTAAVAFASEIERNLDSGAGSIESSSQTAVYGTFDGPYFLVNDGNFTSQAASDAASYGYGRSAKAASASFSHDAQPFPAGPHGGGLYCGHAILRTGGVAIECWWFDQRTSGIVAYYLGYASSVGDGASKTNQIRAAVEHP